MRKVGSSPQAGQVIGQRARYEISPFLTMTSGKLVKRRRRRLKSIHDIHISGLSIASISYEAKKKKYKTQTPFSKAFSKAFFILSLLFLHLLQQSIPLPFFWTFRLWVWDDLVSFVPSSISFRTLVILVIFKDF